MNKTIFQLGILLQFGVWLFLFSLFFVPHTIKAVSVSTNYTDNWIYYQYINRGGCNGGDFKAWTQFYMSLSKSFDLNSSSLGNLNQNESRVIIPGETITGLNYPITGSYNYISGDMGTPPMDDQVYNWDYTSGRGACGAQFNVRNQMRAGIYDQLGYQLSSSNNNIIDCSNGQSCVAKSQNGTATITVSFPGTGSYYVQRAYQFGGIATDYFDATCETEYNEGYWVENWGEWFYVSPTTRQVNCTCPSGAELESGSYDSGDGWVSYNVCAYSYFAAAGGTTVGQNFSYTLNPISYNITVNVPDNPPTISNIQAQEVGYNDGMVSWNYSDADGDAQEWWNVQISTTPGFNPGDIVIWSGEPQIGSGSGSGTKNSNDTSADFFPQHRGKLIPGTTYYTRVRVGNAKASTGWITGPAFTTKINNPPNLDQLSCGGAGTGYTTGQINWNYTGTDESGDELVLKARWKRNLDTDWTLVDLPYNTKSGNIDISNLISGYPYNIEVSLNDNRNSHLGNRWKGCGTLTPENYPEPVVDFSVSKFGDDSTSKTNGQTLELKTGDKLRARWDITETAGLDSCTLSTEGGDLVAGNGFNGNITNNVIDSTSDLSYTIKLNCTGKPANINRAFEQRINVIVLSYPKVSCSIEDDKKSVKTGDSNINIKPVVENVSGLYNWEVKKDVSETAIFRQGTGTIPNPMRLDYTGLEFGRYNPWIKVSVNRPGNPVVTRESTTTCPAIVNFGNTNIREISP